MRIYSQEHHSINSKQARRRLESGHPELSIECPQCHSAAGRTCFMGAGFMGITHRARQALYQQIQLQSSAAPAMAQNRLEKQCAAG
jgi:hypothetical protein